MKLLTRKNILEIKPYPQGKPIKEVERELGIEEVVKLASNENPLGPSPRAVEAIAQALPEINLYPDGNGYYLKRALAAHLQNINPTKNKSSQMGAVCRDGRTSHEVREGNIILGNGSDEIIRMISETFLNEGEEAIMGEPAFLIYRLAVKVMKGQSRLVALKDFTHDLTTMAGMINAGTKLIFIANPNNPTGTMVTAEEVDSFMKKVPEEVIVIFDEAYYEYIERDDFPQTINYIREGRQVITLRTFSKIYGLAGLRIGYGIGPEELIRDMNRVRQPFNTNSLAQVAALSALKDEEHVRQSRQVNREGKDFLYEELEKLKIPCILSQANFILINVHQEGKTISNKLMQEGIIVRPMGMYNLPHFIRVTVGTEKQNQKFIKALRPLCSTLTYTGNA